jgi:hypothetical protein
LLGRTDAEYIVLNRAEVRILSPDPRRSLYYGSYYPFRLMVRDAAGRLLPTGETEVLARVDGGEWEALAISGRGFIRTPLGGETWEIRVDFEDVPGHARSETFSFDLGSRHRDPDGGGHDDRDDDDDDDDDNNHNASGRGRNERD